MSALPTELEATFFLPHLAGEKDVDVINRLAKELGDHVASTFSAAAVAREKRSPTGLPFGDIGVAIPHAEPEHVKTPAIVIASLASPVKFRQMGSPRTIIETTLVVMPALTAKEQAGALLARIIELLQDTTIRNALAAAKTADEMKRALGIAT